MRRELRRARRNARRPDVLQAELPEYGGGGRARSRVDVAALVARIDAVIGRSDNGSR
jgi:hypothetical protein